MTGDAATPSLAMRLRVIVRGVIGIVTTRIRRPPPMCRPAGIVIPLATAERVNAWLDRQLLRIEALMGRIEAGTLRPPRPYAPRPVTEDAADDSGSRPSPEQNLRRAFGWIHAMAQESSVQCQALDRLVNEPAMQVMALATPQMGRLMRPLMRALAVKQPDWMPRPEKRKRRCRAGRRRAARVTASLVSPPEPAPATPPSPTRSPFEPPVVDDPIPYQLSGLWRGVQFPPPRRRW